MAPRWTLRAGAVPFWLTFNTEPSAAWLELEASWRATADRPGVHWLAGDEAPRPPRAAPPPP